MHIGTQAIIKLKSLAAYTLYILIGGRKEWQSVPPIIDLNRGGTSADKKMEWAETAAETNRLSSRTVSERLARPEKRIADQHKRAERGAVHRGTTRCRTTSGPGILSLLKWRDIPTGRPG